MKHFLFPLLLFVAHGLNAQSDGDILTNQPLKLSQYVIEAVTKKYDSRTASAILNLRYSKVSYLSDGLKVTAYLVQPARKGKYPCIISNRGGNLAFGAWNESSVGLYLGLMASWGYVVVASQYRGNDGGEGREAFGGSDINDVLNLLPLLQQVPTADTSRIGIEGSSRGGMTTYLALKRSCRFKAAVSIAGIANAFTTIANRPEMETAVFAPLIPGYWQNKEEALNERSAVKWASQICANTPLLIMHGAADWRVSAGESLELVTLLHKQQHPVRFILFEGADHSLTEVFSQAMQSMRQHFDFYLRDANAVPNNRHHGL